MKTIDLVSFCENGKWGLKNGNGQTIIPAIYQEEIHFYSDYATAKLNGKYGFIDQTGKPIIPFVYTDAGIFEFGVGDVSIHGKWGCVDKTGKLIIPCEHMLPLSFNSKEDVVAVNKGGTWHHIEGKIIDGKWGLINIQGEMIVPFKYDNIRSLTHNRFQVKLNNKYWIIDDGGKEVSP
jgi:hypothetical protein